MARPLHLAVLLRSDPHVLRILAEEFPVRSHKARQEESASLSQKLSSGLLSCSQAASGVRDGSGQLPVQLASPWESDPAGAVRHKPLAVLHARKQSEQASQVDQAERVGGVGGQEYWVETVVEVCGQLPQHVAECGDTSKHPKPSRQQIHLQLSLAQTSESCATHTYLT